jgi:hypothetical protein
LRRNCVSRFLNYQTLRVRCDGRGRKLVRVTSRAWQGWPFGTSLHMVNHTAARPDEARLLPRTATSASFRAARGPTCSQPSPHSPAPGCFC